MASTTPISPLNHAEITAGSITLKWVTTTFPPVTHCMVYFDTGGSGLTYLTTVHPNNGTFPYDFQYVVTASGGLSYWRIDTYTDSDPTVVTGAVWDFHTPLPSKPTTPTPANNATEVNFSGKQLSWVNGGGATSYDVYIGPVGSLVQVATAQTGTSKTVTLAQCPLEQKIYWRVDAKNDAGTVTGDVWNFDARPAKVTTPTPGIDATGQSVFPTYEWNASTIASSYTLNIGIDTLTGTLSRIIGGLTSPTYDTSVVDFRHGYIWGYNSLYVWRVDAKNEFGTTEGDEWTFYTTHSNNFPWERPFDYNPDYSWAWDVDHYDWVDATLLAVGGGRYKQQLVAVGHGVIYFEE